MAPNPRKNRNEIDEQLGAHLPALTAFVRLRLGSLIRANESCSDIVQSACREVLEHADRFQFKGEPQFRHWLFTTALRKITDRQRYYLAGKRRPPLAKTPAPEGSGDDGLVDCYAAALPSPSQEAIKNEDIEKLERAFDRLPKQDREVVILARIVGLPPAEIAKETGQTAGAVRVRLSRALTKLAVLMREAPEPGDR
jgi:RNA polymerase sigma-70 factor (ECF subfamily)